MKAGDVREDTYTGELLLLLEEDAKIVAFRCVTLDPGDFMTSGRKAGRTRNVASSWLRNCTDKL